ncbi:CDP-glucose 4,6-dehydratase [Methylovirgula sp. HY1]|uniref:CDP-glucose 4,6-dehydratase n=1 Tax=Methylovirgula sp. HY1 TaxID=2822761 RepID=UPI00351D8FDF
MESLVMRPEFWRNRRVLLTGHTGFKGTWLSLWLQQMRAQVRGLALDPPSSPACFDLVAAARGMEDLRGDIRDPGFVTAAMSDFQPEIVIHMAAQSLVRPSYADPVATYAINVMGTAHVLEAARGCASVRAIVVVTSDKCYENREWDRGYREDDAMGGYDPYSSSKACAELVTAAYLRSFFNPERYADHRVGLASARAGNVIGGGDWAVDRLIPDAMRAFASQRELVVRFPEAIRPWQHVLEPLGGYLRLAQGLYEAGPPCAGAWNFGPDAEAERPVRYLAEQITGLWGDGAAWCAKPDSNAPHEAHYLTLDASKARDGLGWHPKLNLDNALALTVAWYKAFSRGQDMHEFTLAQIAAYANTTEPAMHLA